MSNNVHKLYPEIIKTHAEHPHHFEKRPPAAFQAYNPLCGDKFEVYLQAVSTTFNKLYFFGFGCAISKASTSIMVKLLEGRSFDRALKICDHFLRYVDNELPPGENPDYPEFEGFKGLQEFPERRDCATLPWLEMKKYLESKKGN